jgi:hypothetical protein
LGHLDSGVGGLGLAFFFEPTAIAADVDGLILFVAFADGME